MSGNCVIDISEKKIVAGFGDIVIPSDGSVESIEKNAFADCRSLSSVVLPNSVKNIGELAFYSCHNLKEVYLPEGIKEVRSEVFEHCSQLEKVILPESLSGISSLAFGGCNLLKCNDFSAEIEALIAEKRNHRHGYVVVINYKGTKAQWQNVRKLDTYDLRGAAAIVAKCKDGETV